MSPACTFGTRRLLSSKERSLFFLSSLLMHDFDVRYTSSFARVERTFFQPFEFFTKILHSLAYRSQWMLVNIAHYESCVFFIEFWLLAREHFLSGMNFRQGLHGAF